MDINLTLIVQMVVFAIFVLFTMKFVWPPLQRALEERQDKIADGLAAAERGHKELELAQHRAKSDLKQAKIQANEIIDKAHRRAAQLLEEAKQDAKAETQRQAKLAKEQISQEVIHAKEVLKTQVASFVLAGAEKIIQHEIDEKKNKVLLDKLIEEI